MISWKDRASWYDRVARWLESRMTLNGLQRLVSSGERDLCWDDDEWLLLLGSSLNADLDETLDDLGSALDQAIMRVYHGTRVADAGVFHREGLKLHDSNALMDEARRIVAEEDDLAWMRPSLEARLAEACRRFGSDAGRLYVCIDDRVQLEHIGHYCLYGSEWISGALGPGARNVLLRRGLPTMVELDLPLSWVSHSMRTSLARHLVREWTRAVVNRSDWVPQIDFCFMLQMPLPSYLVVGHSHQSTLPDLHDQYRLRRSDVTHCPSCVPNQPTG